MSRRVLFTGGSVFLLAHLLLCLDAPGAFGQGTATGVISGTVIDTTGAVIPGAEVTITNKATLRATMVTTNPTGFYSASALEAGIYDVSIKKEGFKAFVREGVKLDPGENLGQNATLDVGSTTTTVTVAASAAKIETVSGESSGTITGSRNCADAEVPVARASMMRRRARISPSLPTNQDRIRPGGWRRCGGRCRAA